MPRDPDPPPDLETLITATVAHVDQLTAEHRDPQTTPVRKMEIQTECRALYNMLLQLQKEQGPGHP